MRLANRINRLRELNIPASVPENVFDYSNIYPKKPRK
jgi:hypothetical protein